MFLVFQESLPAPRKMDSWDLCGLCSHKGLRAAVKRVKGVKPPTLSSSISRAACAEDGGKNDFALLSVLTAAPSPVHTNLVTLEINFLEFGRHYWRKGNMTNICINQSLPLSDHCIQPVFLQIILDVIMKL